MAAVRVAACWLRGFQGGGWLGAGSRGQTPTARAAGEWMGEEAVCGRAADTSRLEAEAVKVLWLWKRYVCVRNSRC